MDTYFYSTAAALRFPPLKLLIKEDFEKLKRLL
jgi:hypothetical protein